MSKAILKEAWRDLDEPHARLRWARMYWQERAGAIGASAKDAAQSLGMADGTYRAYEREPGSSKHTPMGHQEANRFARKFGVSWLWLLLNEGTPFDNQLPVAQERVLKAMSLADEDQQNALADMIEAFIKKSA